MLTGNTLWLQIVRQSNILSGKRMTEATLFMLTQGSIRVKILSKEQFFFLKHLIAELLSWSLAMDGSVTRPYWNKGMKSVPKALNPLSS